MLQLYTLRSFLLMGLCVFFVSCATSNKKTVLINPALSPKVPEEVPFGVEVLCMDVLHNRIVVYPGESSILLKELYSDNHPMKRKFDEFLRDYNDQTQCHILIRPQSISQGRTLRRKLSSRFHVFTDLVDSKYEFIKLPAVTTIPTKPLTALKPLYIEINSEGRILHIPKDKIDLKVEKTIKQLTSKAGSNRNALLSAISTEKVIYKNYRVDLAYYLTGVLALYSIEGAKAYDFNSQYVIDKRNWLNDLFSKIDHEHEILTCIVRGSDEAFEAFAKLKIILAQIDIPYSFEVAHVREPLKFGLGGESMSPQ